jgi:hypothetical protein
LYNWQKKYKEYGENGLILGNRCPKQKRQSQIPKGVKDFIKDFRHRAYCQNASQNTIKPQVICFLSRKQSKKAMCIANRMSNQTIKR